VKSLTTIPKNAGIETEIEKALQLPLREEFPTDLLYFEYPPADNLLGYEKKLHNDSMIFIANIHRKSASSARWKKLTTSTQVTVSIDLFYCGILFIRKEQAKEHFKIRI